MSFIQRVIPNFTIRRVAHTAAILGSIALLAALIVYLSESALTTPVFVLLVIGLGGLSIWLVLAPDELRDWLMGRQVYYGIGSFILTLIVIAIATVGYSLAVEQNVIIDLTETQNYTISQPSINVLENIENRLRVLSAQAESAGIESDLHFRLVGFYTREQLRDQKSAEFLLRQYVEASTAGLRLEFYDPDVNPLLARQFGYSVIFDNTQITSGPIFLALYDGDQLLTVENIGEPTERNVQNAMLRISLAGEFKVYFIQGQLEADITIESDVGYSAAALILRERGILVDTLRLQDVEAIPEDATAIVILGAQAPYSQAQVDKIADYIERGGRMLVLADPPYADSRDSTLPNRFMLEGDSFNTYLWETFGVRFRENLVADPASSARNEFILTGLRVNTGSPPLRDFQNVPMVMTLARSLDIVEQPTEKQAEYVRSIMILAATSAFGERNLQVVDLGNLSEFDPNVDDAGDQVLATAIYRVNELEQEVQPRIILIGDSDWLANLYISPEDGSDGVLGNIL
ncbi:MAG: hypothetical protein CUN55_11070, partial [Phototrophicales bacterium]